MNRDKVSTMRISCNINASGRLKVDITVEKAEKIIYLFIYLQWNLNASFPLPSFSCKFRLSCLVPELARYK
jgi:hypothetical protein